MEELFGELQELFASHNAAAALSAKALFKPTKEFRSASMGTQSQSPAPRWAMPDFEAVRTFSASPR